MSWSIYFIQKETKKFEEKKIVEDIEILVPAK